MSFLDKELVNLHGSAKNADEAIVQAGELLVNAGYVSEQYVEKWWNLIMKMVRTLSLHLK